MSYSYSAFGAEDEDGDPEYVYFNATIINNRTEVAQDEPDPAVRFQETRQQPIIKNASKYNYSIVRANLNGPNKDLPIFMPVIRTGVDNPAQDVDLTIYSITVELEFQYVVGGNNYSFTASSTQPVRYEPETLDLQQAPVPANSTTQTGQDVSTRYYWVYTYSHWLDLVNNAFSSAYGDINAQFQANWSSPTGWNLPGIAPAVGTTALKMTYNPNDNLFTLYADRYGFGGTDATSFGTNSQEQARVWFNSNMFGLFSNFKNYYVNLPNERTNEIIISSILYQNILTLASPPSPVATSYWVMVQDYPSTSSLWCPVESIVFTSTMLPLVFEQTGNPVKFGESLSGQSGNIEAAFTPIVTDISLTNESASDYRQFIQYIPSAEYRMASFQRSKFEVYNIDIQIFWKNRLDGNLYPLTMFNGSSVSVKSMFRRHNAPFLK
jgi:hypothetical protein